MLKNSLTRGPNSEDKKKIFELSELSCPVMVATSQTWLVKYYFEMLLSGNYIQYLIITYNGRKCKKTIYTYVCAVLSRSVVFNSLSSQD